ncbi:MAG TPA: cystathionine gamma-synthase family protein [Acidobacteriota bacterium]|nr:cystathionine gamma-synthase family protein [Acidobacteriota bacterium]
MSKDKRHVSIEGHDLRPESLMMSYGYNPALSEGAVKPPIFQTSTFVFKNAEEGKAFFEIAYGLRERGPNERLGLIYSRLNNPDLEVLEDRLTLWDKAEACAVFGSGMAACSTVLFEFLRPGDVVLYSQPVYGGTDYLIKHILPRYGIVPVGFYASHPTDEVEQVLVDSGQADKLKLVFLETPANPSNAIVDIENCARIANKYSSSQDPAYVAVDNTFLGPLWQQPLRHGADLVLYSATKYIGGHSDLIGGVCLGSRALIDRVKTLRTFVGNMPDAWTGWLLLRSLETLKLRMTCQMKNARYVADFLADHPQVERVHYLGHIDLEDARYKLYKKQCLAPGGMISFEIVGGQEAAFRFLNSLQLFKLAVSLGGTESLAEHPSTMTHADVSKEDQAKMGITEGLIRLSIGVEHPQDLLADLEQALAAV